MEGSAPGASRTRDLLLRRNFWGPALTSQSAGQAPFRRRVSDPENALMPACMARLWHACGTHPDSAPVLLTGADSSRTRSPSRWSARSEARTYDLDGDLGSVARSRALEDGSPGPADRAGAGLVAASRVGRPVRACRALAAVARAGRSHKRGGSGQDCRPRDRRSPAACVTPACDLLPYPAQLTPLVANVAPELVALPGVGVDPPGSSGHRRR